MTPINVGIIGAGYRGVNTLAERIVEIANETGLRVTAIHDTRQERLDETQIYLQDQFQKQGIDLAIAKHANANALIKDPNVDLVMVTTPQSAHKDPTITALESGKKVYLDKPIAHTLDDAIAIIEAEKRTNNPMILGFTRRYEAPWRKAYELLKDGVIGELHMLQIRDIIPFHTFFHRWHRNSLPSGVYSAANKGCVAGGNGRAALACRE